MEEGQGFMLTHVCSRQVFLNAQVMFLFCSILPSGRFGFPSLFYKTKKHYGAIGKYFSSSTVEVGKR